MKRMFNWRSSTAGSCGASSHPALAGGSGLALGLGLGYHFWQEALEGPESPAAKQPHTSPAPFCADEP